MFSNVGRKIQLIAKIFMILNFVLFVLSGVATAALPVTSNGIALPLAARIVAGVLIALLGCLFTYIGQLMVLGFGKLVENAEDELE